MDQERFDELAKTLASGVSRREALRKIGGGLLGAALAALLPTKADAKPGGGGGGKTAEGNCPQGFNKCRGKCYILAEDRNNCGACGVVCPEGRPCCGGTCTDVERDGNNCGACGNVCTAGDNPFCGGGVCTDLTTDPNNCGLCGTVCPPCDPTSSHPYRVCVPHPSTGAPACACSQVP